YLWALRHRLRVRGGFGGGLPSRRSGTLAGIRRNARRYRTPFVRRLPASEDSRRTSPEFAHRRALPGSRNHDHASLHRPSRGRGCAGALRHVLVDLCRLGRGVLRRSLGDGPMAVVAHHARRALLDSRSVALAGVVPAPRERAGAWRRASRTKGACALCVRPNPESGLLWLKTLVVVLCGADAHPTEVRREGFAELFRLCIRMEI